MKRKKNKNKWISVSVLMGFLVCGVGFAGDDPIPGKVAIRNEFQPGTGPAVGRIQIVRGQVIILHEDMEQGFRAREKQDLFQGDTIVTRTNGRISFVLNDGSILTLAGNTKMIIHESIFNSAMETRVAGIEMKTGKARFKVAKPVGFRKTSFKVKTGTALLKVDGSEFLVWTDGDTTSIVTFADTRLTVIGLPEACLELWDIEKIEECGPEPAVLSDNQMVHVDKGALRLVPEKSTGERVHQKENNRTNPTALNPSPVVMEQDESDSLEGIMSLENIFREQLNTDQNNGPDDLPLPPKEP